MKLEIGFLWFTNEKDEIKREASLELGLKKATERIGIIYKIQCHQSDPFAGGEIDGIKIVPAPYVLKHHYEYLHKVGLDKEYNIWYLTKDGPRRAEELEKQEA